MKHIILGGALRFSKAPFVSTLFYGSKNQQNELVLTRAMTWPYRKFKDKGRFRNPERPEDYITLHQTPGAKTSNYFALLKNVRSLTGRAALKLHQPPNWYYITLQRMPGAPPIKLHTKPKIACAL